jgi:hypothetical protein
MMLKMKENKNQMRTNSKTYFNQLNYFVLLVPLLFFCMSGISQTIKANAKENWWSDATELSLSKSGANRIELLKALRQVPIGQREGIQFLVENMPLEDLQSIKAVFLLENLAMTYTVMQEVPWAKSIPLDIFLNDVLPYASVNESRDDWRKRLYEICQPLIKHCKTPAEAAMALNQQIFKLLKVKYSTKRRVPNQGPFETMATGVATCTGLSILLVDACRAIGVPARIVGTPLWSNNSGNHTWVEIWDGSWLFTGAAEQNPNGFNRGWFVDNASKAIKDNQRHAIYATSFKKTNLNFPLSWAKDVDHVSAINVTDSYTQNAKPVKISGLSLMVDVYDKPLGERVSAKVIIADAANKNVTFTGISKGDTADMNDHLFFQLPKQKTYVLEVEYKNQKYNQYYSSGIADEDKLPIFLSGIPSVPAPSKPLYSSPAIINPLPIEDASKLKDALMAFFKAPAIEQASWIFPRRLEKLLNENEAAVRQLVWESYRTAPIHDSLKQDFDSNQVRFEKHISPYSVKTVGKRPANGWGLFIAMHGGGGTTQEFNDSQWRRMQTYYRDHPEVGGYIYIALRAPNNTWNGFYTGYTYPLIQNLLRQFMLFADVDPNKKFIMGYSHGGYGAFAIGPKMPDYFAAIHSSASSLADGANPTTLRNTVFTTMVGSKDTMYGRYKNIVNFQKEIQVLRGNRTDIYPVTVQIIANHPHSGLPDRDKIAEMYANVRNPVPSELTWRLSDNVIHDFFWLQTNVPKAGMNMNANIQKNNIVAQTNLTEASILLDSRLIDFKKPVVLELNGKKSIHKLKPSLRIFCQTMQERGDPELAFTTKMVLELNGIVKNSAK